jgi:hypothetical protein
MATKLAVDPLAAEIPTDESKIGRKELIARSSIDTKVSL